MIGDKGAELIAYARSLNYPTRMSIKPITRSPHVFMAGPDIDPEIILTNGQYHLVFHTKTRTGKINAIKKFDIVFDFGCKLLKVENYRELQMQAKTNKYAKFFFEYTNICSEMFVIAGLNEGMHIPITFDVVKYYKDVCEKQGWKIGDSHMILNPYREDNCKFWGVKNDDLIYYDISKKNEEAKE